MIEVLGIKYYDRWEAGKMLNMSAYCAYIRAQQCGIESHKFGRRFYWTLDEIKTMAEWRSPKRTGNKKTVQGMTGTQPVKST